MVWKNADLTFGSSFEFYRIFDASMKKKTPAKHYSRLMDKLNLQPKAD